MTTKRTLAKIILGVLITTSGIVAGTGHSVVGLDGSHYDGGWTGKSNDRYRNDHPVTPYIGGKWRVTLACMSWFVAVVAGVGGFLCIKAAGLVKEISIRNVVWLIAGATLIIISWAMIHVGLDIYELDRIYLGHMFF